MHPSWINRMTDGNDTYKDENEKEQKVYGHLDKEGTECE